MMLDEATSDPKKYQKSYFLYFNNTIRELSKKDLQYVLSFSSEKIKEKIHFHNLH